MLHVYEFEVFEDDGMQCVIPYDLEGATQGVNFDDACFMAADWLQITMEHMAMNEIPFPKATFGNKPRYGGQNIVVAVNAGKESVPKVTAAEAARRLGVTRGRVSQMIKSGLLETFNLDGRTWVTEHSVDARLAEMPKAGRPKKLDVV